MNRNDFWFESDDGTRLKLHRWIPANEGSQKAGEAKPPRAVLHIVHGMAEYSLRYERLAAKLVPAGIEVWAADQRGHGNTADLDVNKPGAGGKLGHCADKDGFKRVVKDINNLNMEIRKTLPGVPLFQLGHSWGSFITLDYIEEFSGQLLIDGCILSGTMGPGGLVLNAGLPVLTSLATVCGERNGSPVAKAMADGSYNNAFKPNRTPFDWISRDEKEVDFYVESPLCGFLCSTGFYRDLVRGLIRIHKRQSIEKINPGLPVYIFSGSQDPVGNMGVGPTALVDALRSRGFKDLEFVLYPSARHETLNETNREEVMGNLLSWLERHIEKTPEDES